MSLKSAGGGNGWSCCFGGASPHHLYTGGPQGKVLLYDTRLPGRRLGEWSLAVDGGPPVLSVGFTRSSGGTTQSAITALHRGRVWVAREDTCCALECNAFASVDLPTVVSEPPIPYGPIFQLVVHRGCGGSVDGKILVSCRAGSAPNGDLTSPKILILNLKYGIEGDSAHSSYESDIPSSSFYLTAEAVCSGHEVGLLAPRPDMFLLGGRGDSNGAVVVSPEGSFARTWRTTSLHHHQYKMASCPIAPER